VGEKEISGKGGVRNFWRAAPGGENTGQYLKKKRQKMGVVKKKSPTQEKKGGKEWTTKKAFCREGKKKSPLEGKKGGTRNQS